MPEQHDTNQLRAMVRDVLAEVLAASGVAGVQPGSGGAAVRVERVSLGNDAALAAFVESILDPLRIDEIRAGRLRFALAVDQLTQSGATLPRSDPPPKAPVLDGLITEQSIVRLGKIEHAILSADARVTPLAQDKARQLGIRLERTPRC